MRCVVPLSTANISKGQLTLFAKSVSDNMTLALAADELALIRTNRVDEPDVLLGRVDQIGKWLDSQRRTDAVIKLLEECDDVADELQRGRFNFGSPEPLTKSLVHAYQRRTHSGQSVQVGEYTNKVQKKPEPTHAGRVRAVVPVHPGTPPPLKRQPHPTKAGPPIGETSSGAAIHTDSHRRHEGWSRADHFEAAQAHREQAHKHRDTFGDQLGAPYHSTDQETAHLARAAYHSRMAEGDTKGATAIAKYDHRFGEHLEGHQANQPPKDVPSVQGDEHDSEKFIADLVQEILAGAAPKGEGPDLTVDTQKLHKLPSGEYKPERAVMHKRILEARLAKAEPQEAPEAVFMGGGSASGKGTIQKRGLIKLPANAITADADLLKVGDPEGHETGTPFRGIPEFWQLANGGKSDMAAAFVHEESSDLNADLTNACYLNGYHVVIDGTGDGSIKKMGQKVQAAKDAGHKVRAIYCTVPTDMAVERSMERAKKTGREVPEKAVRALHAGVSKIFPEVTKLFDDLELWDNSVDPKLIYSKKSGSGDTVHDPEAYKSFLDKANESVEERFDRETGKVRPLQKAAPRRGDSSKKRRVWMVPNEWPEAGKKAESLKRLKKYGLHEHNRDRKRKQPPKGRGHHR